MDSKETFANLEAGKQDRLFAENLKLENPKIFLIFGLEGSGKSTQAELLSERLNIPWINFGDVFREIADTESDTQLGKICKRLVDNREFADFNTYKAVFKRKFTVKNANDDEFARGMVLDGAVRTDEQVDAFKSLIKESGRDHMMIVSLFYKLPGWLAYDRQSKRGRNDTNSYKGIMAGLTNSYLNLGQRMLQVKEMSDAFLIIPVNQNESINDIHSKTIDKLDVIL